MQVGFIRGGGQIIHCLRMTPYALEIEDIIMNECICVHILAHEWLCPKQLGCQTYSSVFIPTA